MEKIVRIRSSVFVLILLAWAASVCAAEDNIFVSHFDSSLVKGVPAGWVLDLKSGKPFIRMEKSGDEYCVHLYSNQSAFGIKKGVPVDIREYPFLNWEWAATKLPKGGDVRRSGSDDQALQIYIAFPTTGWPEKVHTPILGYLWDCEAPKEFTGRSPQLGGGKVRYIVIRNKTDKLSQWYNEKRNVYEDFKNLFSDINHGEPTGPIQGVEIYINSQHTGTSAEGFVGTIYFSKN